MIYAEWTLYGEFDNGIFPTWDAYHAATFNPDIEINVVRVIKEDQPRTGGQPAGAYFIGGYHIEKAMDNATGRIL